MKQIDVKLLLRSRMYSPNREVLVDWRGYSIVPGLAVVKTPNVVSWSSDEQAPILEAGQGWQVIHMHSGLLISPPGTHTRTRKDALAITKNMASLTDWTVSAAEISKIRGLALKCANSFAKVLGLTVRVIRQPVTCDRRYPVE